jgi:molybdopterin-containing oxidoreductase family membrane subunit
VIACNVVAPQLLWLHKARSTPWMLFIVAMFVNVGMWLERYLIVVTSLSRDFMPSSWGRYQPTVWDWATFIGTIGMFLFLLLLFIRFLPMISISEMRMLLPEAEQATEEGHASKT